MCACVHENNVPSWLSPQWLCTHALGHIICPTSCASCTQPNIMCPSASPNHHTSCAQVHELSQSHCDDNRGAHCFHENIYIMLTLLLWDLSTLCDAHHLWSLIYLYLYLSIYLFIYLSISIYIWYSTLSDIFLYILNTA